MNKKVIGIVVAVVVILIAAIWFVLSKKSSVSPSAQAPAQSEQAVAEQPASPASNIISSIKDAMGLGKQMKCTYTSNKGSASFEATTYVEGTKYKSVLAVGGKNMNSLFDGTNVYMWEDGKTTGTKIAMSCMADLKSSLPKEQQDSVNAPVKDPADNFNSATDTKCVPSSEADMSVPASVTFTDQCDMMKKSIEMMKNIKLPANVPGVPSGIQQ